MTRYPSLVDAYIKIRISLAIGERINKLDLTAT